MIAVHMHTYYSCGCVLNINAPADLPFISVVAHPPSSVGDAGSAVSWFVVNTNARVCEQDDVLDYPDGTICGNITVMEYHFENDQHSAPRPAGSSLRLTWVGPGVLFDRVHV